LGVKPRLGFRLAVDPSEVEAEMANQATAEQVRSFDPNVFFRLDSGDSGWANLHDSPLAHGIAASAQAAGKKLFFKFTSFNPNGAAQGVGSFQGVQVALQDF
jgi:hypothetical protein